MTHRALLLVNQHSRRGQQEFSKALTCLESRGFELIQEPDVTPQNYADVIKRASDRVDLVIVGGGDGTLNAAADGLIESRLPLGILPLGTANDLARTLGIPRTMEEACDVIVDQHSQAIDVGWVNGKHFFNVASLGLSVQITQQLSKEVKRRWGVLAYAITAIRVLTQSRPFSAEIRMGAEVRKVKTVQIAVGNGRHYGGGLIVAEDAQIDDQRLDLYSLELKHWWQMIPLLPAMRSGTFEDWDFMYTQYGREVEVRTRSPHSINTDGEITTQTPAHFKVIPKAIRVFVPTVVVSN